MPAAAWFQQAGLTAAHGTWAAYHKRGMRRLIQDMDSGIRAFFMLKMLLRFYP